MSRLRAYLVLAAAAVLLVALPVPAQATSPDPLPELSVWNRLDMDHSNPAPEHERLSCSRGLTWTCRYDKVPEPALAFWWDTTSGSFTGSDVTAGWQCPGWFPTSICANVTRVIAGTMTINRADGISFSGPFDLVLARGGADAQVLHVYWPVFGFTCPWYRTFDEALAANPTPLPFDGTDWPPLDCAFAP